MASGYKEIRGKMGFFGRLWRVLFWGWQLVMFAFCIAGTAEIAPMTAEDEAGRAGALLGMALDWYVMLGIWLWGSILFGTFALLTQPARAFVPVEDD